MSASVTGAAVRRRLSTMMNATKCRRYCEAVFLAGCLAVLLAHSSLHFAWIVAKPDMAVLLALGVVLAEQLPVKIPRRDNEVITLSTSFSMALLLACGLGAALLAQCLATAFQDIFARKPWWRVRFNLGQYALSLVIAFLVLERLGATSHIGSSHPFTNSDLPAVLLSLLAYFIVNTGVVGVAVATYQDVRLRRYFHNGFSFVLITAGVLLVLAPIVIATAAYSPVLIPLIGAPILVIYNALWQGEKSEHAARHDALTGLPNRSAFAEAVEAAIEDPRVPASLLLMDLDRFKEVNDTLGHHNGDLLLQKVSERILAGLRRDEFMARLGGDEFAVVRANCDRDGAADLAQRISDSLGAPFELEQTVVDVQSSIGIAMFPDDGQDAETLLQKADVAMYRAKETRSDFAAYSERHDHHSRGKLALSADLRVGLDRAEIVAVYQPVLDLRRRTVAGVEALARWRHPELGLLQPEQFIDTAEKTKLITPLTYRILDLALAQIDDWKALGFELSAAVNVSARVLTDPAFPGRVLRALEASGASADRLKLEVTESTLMFDPAVTSRILHEFHSHGIEISIDDFGTGYSSLAYLADLPVSEVKIDRSFISRMREGNKEAIIVNSTIDLAHHLGMRTVAEGVEEEELLAVLRDNGCDAAQGYAIAKPMEPADATAFLIDAPVSEATAA